MSITSNRTITPKRALLCPLRARSGQHTGACERIAYVLQDAYRDSAAHLQPSIYEAPPLTHSVLQGLIPPRPVSLARQCVLPLYSWHSVDVNFAVRG